MLSTPGSSPDAPCHAPAPSSASPSRQRRCPTVTSRRRARAAPNLVCDGCASTLMGPRTDGKVSNPSGTRDALRERYGDGYAAWT